MLPAINRLTKDKDFTAVFKKGRSSYDDLSGVKAVNNSLGITRLAVLVGSKVSKKAIIRNLVKRRIRYCLGQELERLRKGLDIVVITLPPIKDRKYDEISKSIKNNLRKAGIYS